MNYILVIFWMAAAGTQIQTIPTSSKESCEQMESTIKKKGLALDGRIVVYCLEDKGSK